METPKISIIVTHRILDSDLLYLSSECLKRIKEKTFYPYQLISIDNAGNPSAISCLTYNSDIYIRNNVNRGNGMVWDQGIKLAESDIIILMDNDCWPLIDNWEKEMVDKLSDNQIGATFPSCIVGDDYDKMESGFDVNFSCRRDGFCFAFRKETYLKAGPFLVDQPFKLGYYEDDNFEANVQYNLGLKLIGCESSKVWHKGQATTKKMKDESFELGVKANEEWYNKKWGNKYPYLDN